MACACCTPKCKKWSIFSTAGVLLVLGVLLSAFWITLLNSVMKSQLNIGSKNTLAYGMWKETPIPMYIEFYLFNWTNHDEVVNNQWRDIKPILVEKGPYTFSEKHYREQVVFNDNRTLTFKTKRVWHFLPEKSKGSLDDTIIQFNPMLASMAYMVRDKHEIIDLAVNFLLEEKQTSLSVSKKAGEWLFDGFDDPLLDLIHKLKMKSINVPFKKFGYFVERNESVDYDGIYQVYDGSDDLRKLGRMTLWNGNPHVSYYPGYCGDVNGTNGELWYPPRDDQTVTLFASDTCSSMKLHRSGVHTVHGIDSNKYVGTAELFDNGTKYPDMKCFSPGESSPSGVRDVSQCKFGAPAFISFPHFYLADPWYLDQVEGLSPDKSKHELYMALEPNTGIPTYVQAVIQINFKLTKIPKIQLLRDVKEIYMPMLWFKQSAELSGSLAAQTKLLLILPSLGNYTGYILCGLGALLLAVAIFVTYKKGWRGSDGEQLLTQETS